MLARLALDIGSSSIGWLLYELADGRPARILDGGSRIFGDGREAKTGVSLAVGRRTARAMRRRRDRYLHRRAMLMKRLAAAGLMPESPEEAATAVLCQYPGPVDERWVVAHVLAVAAGGDGSPVAQFVLIEADDFLFHGKLPRGYSASRRAISSPSA